MIEGWAAALEATALATALRNSVWSYPLVNTAHILGVALLVGSIVPMDLRLLGAWPSVPLAPLWRVLTRTSGVGLVLAIIFGILLFIARATEYIASNIFISKMFVVALASMNALVLSLVPHAHTTDTAPRHGKASASLRVAAGISLIAWLTALILGRLIGYF